jgi:aryl-alcohol dehydrogenase-like predicted oxidoreductase
MEFRTHKDETISEIGIGGYAMSGAYGKKDPQQFMGLLQRAYELGVTFFDTADVYGPAEEIFGQALSPFRKQVWIATKVGANPDGAADCSADHVLASCEQSLKRLQTDYIDLYQIHFDDPGTPVEETLEALEMLKSEGKIRYYGIGHLPLSRLETYFDQGDVFSVLLELSAVARGARQDKIPLCREHGVGVIAFSVTGRGLLTGKIGPDHSFEEDDIRRKLDPLFQRERFASGLRIMEHFRTIGIKYGKTSAQLAIAWVLAQPGMICALTGPSTIPHLEENLGASGWTIPSEDRGRLEQFIDQEEERLRKEQIESVRSILAHELDAENAFADLVYVCESLVELGCYSEQEILAVFQRLWPLRGKMDASALEAMRDIQTELRETSELA